MISLRWFNKNINANHNEFKRNFYLAHVKNLSFITKTSAILFVPEYVYILTDPERTTEQFKIGKHSGSIAKLHSRYRTPIPKHIIVRIYETSDAKTHEAKIHKLLNNYRIDNSEWFNLTKQNVCILVDKYFSNI